MRELSEILSEVLKSRCNEVACKALFNPVYIGDVQHRCVNGINYVYFEAIGVEIAKKRA